MSNNLPDVYYSKGAFLLFEPEHALRLRRNRILCKEIGLTAGPYSISPYAAYIACSHQLANFKRLSLRQNISIEENRNMFSSKLKTFIEGERQRHKDNRLNELEKRSIPVSSANLREFDDTKLRLNVSNLPQDSYSSYETKSLKEELHGLFNLGDHKLIVFRDLYRRGFYITSGLKFGCEFLAYVGDPIRYHSQFTVRILAKQSDEGKIDMSRIKFQEINCFQRLSHTANKISLFAVVFCEDSQSVRVKYWTLEGRELLGPGSTNSVFIPVSPDPKSNQYKFRRTT